MQSFDAQWPDSWHAMVLCRAAVSMMQNESDREKKHASISTMLQYINTQQTVMCL